MQYFIRKFPTTILKGCLLNLQILQNSIDKEVKVQF